MGNPLLLFKNFFQPPTCLLPICAPQILGTNTAGPTLLYFPQNWPPPPNKCPPILRVLTTPPTTVSPTPPFPPPTSPPNYCRAPKKCAQTTPPKNRGAQILRVPKQGSHYFPNTAGPKNRFHHAAPPPRGPPPPRSTIFPPKPPQLGTPKPPGPKNAPHNPPLPNPLSKYFSVPKPPLSVPNHPPLPPNVLQLLWPNHRRSQNPRPPTTALPKPPLPRVQTPWPPTMVSKYCGTNHRCSPYWVSQKPGPPTCSPQTPCPHSHTAAQQNPGPKPPFPNMHPNSAPNTGITNHCLSTTVLQIMWHQPPCPK
ncbi:hypothetical protein PBY51_022249 [Eleginops maclovinus]|uniref:Uncharacterized protein n=1 Tax=Eleginops maclovinus TaxID=56733 RepID=A0AAN7XAK9_ELEMC|nr:hypothetical protein PBY51_022249 [Eleginops maclovinus]